tara:strand:+ start:520 stop:906 length:387 start_codon:yes stop_codon:yes gene_type:complete
MSAQQIINIIDDYKEQLPDTLYKKICDDLLKMNNNEEKYVKVKGVILKPEYSSEDGDLIIREQPVYLCIKLLNKVNKNNEFKLGTVCKERMLMITDKLAKYGYHIVSYGNTEDGDTEDLLILNIEYIN